MFSIFQRLFEVTLTPYHLVQNIRKKMCLNVFKTVNGVEWTPFYLKTRKFKQNYAFSNFISHPKYRAMCDGPRLCRNSKIYIKMYLFKQYLLIFNNWGGTFKNLPCQTYCKIIEISEIVSNI